MAVLQRGLLAGAWVEFWASSPAGWAQQQGGGRGRGVAWSPHRRHSDHHRLARLQAQAAGEEGPGNFAKVDVCINVLGGGRRAEVSAGQAWHAASGQAVGRRQPPGTMPPPGCGPRLTLS